MAAAAGSIFEEASGAGLGLRGTVVLVQAGIEYHVNRLMLERFGTDSFESERINSKLMSLNDVGIIDDTLRQDLIQIARIRHLFAHRREVDRDELLALIRGINRRGEKKDGREEDDPGQELRGRFLSAVRQSCRLIEEGRAGGS